MGLFTNNPGFLVDPMQPNPPGLKDLATRIVNQAKTASPDDPIGLVGRSISTIGSQLATLLGYLKQAIPLPQDLYLTDPTGRVIAYLGFNANGAQQIYGLSFFDLAGNLAAFTGVATDLPKTITATSNGTPDVITIPAHGYRNDDTLLIQGSTGDTAINQPVIVESATTNTFQITTLAGVPINGNGSYGGGGTAMRYFAGGYFQSAYIGGSSPATAKIRATPDGDVTISGARIELDGSAATIVLDPVVGDITVTNAAGTLETIINALGVTVLTLPGTNPFSQQIPGEFDVYDASGALKAIMNYSVGFNSIPGYRVNNVVIVDASRNATFMQLTITGFGLLVNPTGDIDCNSLTIKATAFLISSTGDANLHSLNVNGGGISAGGIVSSVGGLSAVVPLAKLTTGGTAGSITFTNGIADTAGYIAPT